MVMTIRLLKRSSGSLRGSRGIPAPRWNRLAMAAVVLFTFAPLRAQGTLPSSKEARAGSAPAHQDCAKSCHRPHYAPQTQLGFRNFGTEALCLSCHQGQPALPTADRAPKLPTVGNEVSAT